MKNSPLKIFFLVLAVVLVLLPLQWIPDTTIGTYEVKPVKLLSDVLSSDSTTLAIADSNNLPLKLPITPIRNDSCPKGMVCIEDYADESQRGMAYFYEALDRRKQLDRPIRIAYLGDSFIEVDILTSSLRTLLQNKYGGSGVGWLDIAPPYAANRPTVNQRYGGWDSHCVLDKGKYSKELLNIGQRYFTAAGKAWTEIKGVKKAHLDTSEVHTLYLRSSNTVEVGIKLEENPMLALHSMGSGRVEALSYVGRSGCTRWQVTAANGVTFWGVAEETQQGVMVDNFSLRGSSGTTISEIPIENLSQLNEVRPYDLIVLQFGLNVANKTQTDYSRYASQMKHVIENLKQAFPQTGILIVSVGDRENRLADGQIHTLPGVLALIRYQQNLAAECHVAFWNLYNAMGGEGGIRRMAEAKPTEAGKDYTHINARGGERVAKKLYKSLVYGHQQYQKYKANGETP